MDDLIAKRLPDTKTKRIATTTRDYAKLNELTRVNLDTAKSVIFLANCSDSPGIEAQINSDVQSIKRIMGIRKAKLRKDVHANFGVKLYQGRQRKL